MQNIFDIENENKKPNIEQKVNNKIFTISQLTKLIRYDFDRINRIKNENVKQKTLIIFLFNILLSIKFTFFITIPIE